MIYKFWFLLKIKRLHVVDGLLWLVTLWIWKTGSFNGYQLKIFHVQLEIVLGKNFFFFSLFSTLEASTMRHSLCRIDKTKNSLWIQVFKYLLVRCCQFWRPILYFGWYSWWNTPSRWYLQVQKRSLDLFWDLESSKISAFSDFKWKRDHGCWWTHFQFIRNPISQTQNRSLEHWI